MDEQPASPSFDGAIIVGEDGSEPAAAALGWAEALAGATRQPVRSMRADDRAPGEALVAASRDPDVDLVVVGRRGLGRVRGRVLGSVSRHVARHSACSVVVVEGGGTGVPSRIVVGLDGTPQSEQALAWTIELAVLVDAEVVAAHAIGSETIPITAAERPKRFHEWCQPLRDAGVRHRELLAPGRPRDELVRISDQVDADLVVVGTRYDAGERRFVVGSVATALVAAARTPLVIVRGL